MPKISQKLIKKISVEEIDPNIELPKKKSLAQIAAKINARHKGSTEKIQLGTQQASLERIPTGILEVDYKLKGGFVRGRFALLAGGESSWKSSTCLKTISEVQKLGGTAAYIDGERSFDPDYAKALGVDLTQLLVVKPDTAEQTYNDMTQLILEGIDVIVLDSLNILSPKKEMYSDEQGVVAEDIEKEVMGVAQRKASQWIRNNVGRIEKANTLMLVICQLRDNLNAGMYGNPEVIVGGKAIKFISSTTILTRSVNGKDAMKKDDDGNVIGRTFEFKFEKNKTGRDKQVGQFVAYGATIDNFHSMLEIGLKEKIIERPTSKTYIIDGKNYNGKNATLEALVDSSTGAYDFCMEELRKIMGTKIYHYDPYQKQKEVEEAAAVPVNEDGDQNLIVENEDTSNS